MYEYSGTLENRDGMVTLISRDIRPLDVNVDGFYSLFYSSEVNNAMSVALTETKIPGLAYVNPRGLIKLCVSVVKSSVVFMYADNRGLYLEYWSGEEYRRNCFTLHIQWKELGIEDPNESHFDNFLVHLKRGVMGRHFALILAKGSKARKAVLKVMGDISCGMGEIYSICHNFVIQTNLEGSWDLYQDGKLARSKLPLLRITLPMLIRRMS